MRIQHYSKLFLVTGIIFLLVSCKVGRNFEKPNLDLPEYYRLDDVDTAKLMGWEAFFSDTILTGLIGHAISNNFDMRTVMKHIEIAHSYFRQSGSSFYPSVNADLLRVDRQYRSDKFYSTPSSKWYEHKGTEAPSSLFAYQSQYAASLSVSWEADIWGRLRRQKEAAQAGYERSFEVQRALQTSLIATVADSYYSLLMLDEQLEVARRNYTYRNNNLRMVELQYESGEVTALAVQQTESQMLEAAALIPRLEEQIAIHKNGLLLLTGKLPEDLERGIHISDIDTDKEYNVLFNIPLSHIQNRPDVKAAEHKLKAANARVGVAQAFQYPNLTLSLTGGVNAMLPRNWFNIPGALFGGITASLTQPLFNRRRIKTDIEVAKKEREIAEIDFQRQVYEAVVETENALMSIDKAKEQLLIAQQQLKTAQKAVQNADLLFKSGFATYLEVITALRYLLDVELELVTVKTNLLTARIQLYRSLGGGWE